jgi:cellulose synthase/poly-beta-1,6-N-acetylglucosamine synthase-like glycosyltransferase
VPTYNEANVIEFKLKNLLKLNYPKNLIEIILVDSASKDDTLKKILEFQKKHPEACIKLLKEKKRRGKSNALNFALKYADGEVIIVSDADCFWSPDILVNALPYLTDPSVGAIAGREVLLNMNQSWITESEAFYRDLVSVIRLGESKFHSTIFFEGGFSAYKRIFLQEFDYDTGADDSGTAFKIVGKKTRTIFVPEARFFTTFPPSWRGKIALKIRRANQLIRIWNKCLKLLIKRKLQLPKRIAIPQIFLHLFNPLIFLLTVIATAFIGFRHPYLFFSLFLIFLPSKSRKLIIEISQNNFILLSALIGLLINRKFVIWEKVDESRHHVVKDLLKRSNLL